MRSVLLLLLACRDPDPSGDTDTEGDADTDADSDAETDAFPAGEVLFTEPFDDADFEARGWYDGAAGTIVADSHDGNGAFECVFEEGATGCRDGKPARHAIAETETVYLSYWFKTSD